MTTEVATENKELSPFAHAKGMVGKYAQGMIDDKRAQQFMTTMTLMARRDDNFAQCTPDSIIASMVACVALDIMPNTPEQLAYIIPYNNKRTGKKDAQFQIGYKGMVELAYRSGQIKAINSELVFPEDEFEILLGTERVLHHKPDFTIDRTKAENITHVYATAKLSNGENVFEVMSLSELKKIKDSAQAKSTLSPWNTWEESMIKKTAVKRLLKLLPQSSTDNRINQAAMIDSLAEAGKLSYKDGQFVSQENEAPELTPEQQEAIKQESADLAAKLLEGGEIV